MLTAKKLNIVSNKQEITNSISGFPVACYYSEFSPGTYDYIDWHWHVELQLCLTIRGTVHWGTESQKTLVPTGEGIFINSQRVHMARAYMDREAAYPINKANCFYQQPSLLRVMAAIFVWRVWNPPKRRVSRLALVSHARSLAYSIYSFNVLLFNLQIFVYYY